jgi:hypothetical protein
VRIKCLPTLAFSIARQRSTNQAESLRKSDTINVQSILGTIDELHTPSGHQQAGKRRKTAARIMV